MSSHVIDQHAAFRQQLGRIERFVHTVNAHHDRMSPSGGSRNSGTDDVLQHVAVALEDVPQDLHESVRLMLMHPNEDASVLSRLGDIAANASGGGFGDIEDITKRMAWLHILSTLGIRTPYTYQVDAKVIRGSRPTPDKLRRLSDGGCHATINLCEEMVDGDSGLIAAAGLTKEQMDTRQIGIKDNHPPALSQVDDLLAYLASFDGPVYVHCEAGIGRTSVMVACYRMRRQGWTLADAYHEARQFGCAMPDQLAFIEAQGSQTAARATGVLPPSDEELGETAEMNRDPVGLDRVLGSIAAGAI